MSSVNPVGGLHLSALDRRLLHWLDTDELRFERYIERHPEAADRVEQLLALSTDAQRMVGEALAQALAVPAGLLDRLADSVVSTGRETEPMSVALDLLGAGAATLLGWLDG